MTEYGWLTTPRTKPYLVKEVSRHLPTMECHDTKIVGQMRGVRYADTLGRDAYVHIGLSDLFMSTGIAICSQTDARAGGRGYAGQAKWNPGGY
jgi:hypothetical protein